MSLFVKFTFLSGLIPPLHFLFPNVDFRVATISSLPLLNFKLWNLCFKFPEAFLRAVCVHQRGPGSRTNSKQGPWSPGLLLLFSGPMTGISWLVQSVAGRRQGLVPACLARLGTLHRDALGGQFILLGLIVGAHLAKAIQTPERV